MGVNHPDFEQVVTGTINRLVKKKVIDETTAQEATSGLVRGVSAMYHRQELFTVCCLVSTESFKHRSVGVSKRNPDDHPSQLRGEALALSRAVVDYALNRAWVSQ